MHLNYLTYSRLTKVVVAMITIDNFSNNNYYNKNIIM